MVKPLTQEGWPLEYSPPALQHPRRQSVGMHHGAGRHRHASRSTRSVALLGAATGMELALLNVYPMLYPWQTPLQKVIGLAVCTLLAALGARAVHVADEGGLDLGLVVLGIALLLVIALAAVVSSAPTGAGPPPATLGAPRPGWRSATSDPIVHAAPDPSERIRERGPGLQ